MKKILLLTTLFLLVCLKSSALQTSAFFQSSYISSNSKPIMSKVAAMPNLNISMLLCNFMVVMNDTTPILIQISNTGAVDAQPCLLKLYASEDETIDNQDLLLSTINVPLIKANSSETINQYVLIPATISRYILNLIALVDANNTVAESDETDNIRYEGMAIDHLNSFGKVMVSSNTNGLGTWQVIGFPKKFKFQTLVNDVPQGSQTITFSPVVGFETPDDTTIVVISQETTSFSAVYQKLSSAINESSLIVNTSYPNPATDEFNIELLDASECLQVKLFNSEGKEVFVKSDLRLKQISLDVSSLQQGLYYVKVITPEHASVISFFKK